MRREMKHGDMSRVRRRPDRRCFIALGAGTALRRRAASRALAMTSSRRPCPFELHWAARCTGASRPSSDRASRPTRARPAVAGQLAAQALGVASWGRAPRCVARQSTMTAGLHSATRAGASMRSCPSSCGSRPTPTTASSPGMAMPDHPGAPLPRLDAPRSAWLPDGPSRPRDPGHRRSQPTRRGRCRPHADELDRGVP